MPHDLTAQPVEEMLAALRDALDVIDCGIVLLAPDMRVRFVNRRFTEFAATPQEVSAVGRSFRDLFGRATADPGCTAPDNAVRAHIEQREAEIRTGTVAASSIELHDGRRLLFRCVPSPDGGRVLTYTDITWTRQQEDQEHAARDAAERMEVEFRFNKETLEDQAPTLSRSPRNQTRTRGAPRRRSVNLSARSSSASNWRRNCGGWQPWMR